jgi:hypothetical protein
VKGAMMPLNSLILRFLVSAVISVGPFLVKPNLFVRDFGLPEIFTLVFWFLGLLALTMLTRLLNGNVRIFFPTVLGFASGYFAWSIFKFRNYPVPIGIYIQTFVGPTMFSSITCGIGLAAASGFRTLKKIQKSGKR